MQQLPGTSEDGRTMKLERYGPRLWWPSLRWHIEARIHSGQLVSPIPSKSEAWSSSSWMFQFCLLGARGRIGDDACLICERFQPTLSEALCSVYLVMQGVCQTCLPPSECKQFSVGASRSSNIVFVGLIQHRLYPRSSSMHLYGQIR